jgi:hypothetical protein
MLLGESLSKKQSDAIVRTGNAQARIDVALTA